MPNKKNYKNKRGKGIIGDTLGTIGKSAYYVAAKIIDPSNDLRYGEIHQPLLTTSGIKFSKTSGPGTHILSRLVNN